MASSMGEEKYPARAAMFDLFAKWNCHVCYSQQNCKQLKEEYFSLNIPVPQCMVEGRTNWKMVISRRSCHNHQRVQRRALSASEEANGVEKITSNCAK